MRYDINSPIYKLWEMCNTKPTVDNMFISVEREWQGNQYVTIPKNNFCAFWRSIILYLFVQIPFLLLIGVTGMFFLVVAPLMSVFFAIIDPNFFTDPSEWFSSFVLFCSYMAIMVLVALQRALKGTDKPTFMVTIETAYDAYKNKYCPTLEFYNSKEEKKNDQCN